MGTEDLKPIERDEAMDRDYIPLPGGWEVQTLGKGSSFRLCEPSGRRHIVTDEHLHDVLTNMGHDIRDSWNRRTPAGGWRAIAEAPRDGRKVLAGRFSQFGEWLCWTARATQNHGVYCAGYAPPDYWHELPTPPITPPEGQKT